MVQQSVRVLRALAHKVAIFELPSNNASVMLVKIRKKNLLPIFYLYMKDDIFPGRSARDLVTVVATVSLYRRGSQCDAVVTAGGRVELTGEDVELIQQKIVLAGQKKRS